MHGLHQALLVHSQGFHRRVLDFFQEPIQQGMVYVVIHVAQHYVGFGKTSHGKNFHGQTGIPNPPANQSCVRYQGFHKPIPGADDHLVPVGLAAVALRISPYVDGNCLVKAVYH